MLTPHPSQHITLNCTAAVALDLSKSDWAYLLLICYCISRLSPNCAHNNRPGVKSSLPHIPCHVDLLPVGHCNVRLYRPCPAYQSAHPSGPLYHSQIVRLHRQQPALAEPALGQPVCCWHIGAPRAASVACTRLRSQPAPALETRSPQTSSSPKHNRRPPAYPRRDTQAASGPQNMGAIGLEPTTSRM